MLSKGHIKVRINDIIDKVSEFEILAYYIGIKEIPTVICSPLRKENSPSFGLYSNNGKSIYYTDFSTKDRGNTFTLLSKLWNKGFWETLEIIFLNIDNIINKTNKEVNEYRIKESKALINTSNIKIECIIRDWKPYDIEYWESFGIPIKWLDYANVYPISHKIIIKNKIRYIFGADKYAYAFVEFKEQKTTLKIYQPLNAYGYKWCNKHDKSVLSLWTKIPKRGSIICICSSLKDALCLWVNMDIPSIAVQGEGFNISNTAIQDLRSRFKKIFILFDNDEAGINNSIDLSKTTGIPNIIIPQFEGGKDISDLFKTKGRKQFIKTLLPLFINSLKH